MSILNSLAALRDSFFLRRRLLNLAKSEPMLVRTLMDCVYENGAETLSSLQQLASRQEAMRSFAQEFERFSALLRAAGHESLSAAEAYPCLDDRVAQTEFDRHYVYHPAWAARVLAKFPPRKHVDISSTLHFSTLVSAFVEVEFYDFRPAQLKLSNFTSSAADLTQLAFASNSIESLSCMHVIEHIGLGRYGDPFDVDGDRKAVRELSRVLAPDGRLIVAFPVGRPRIQYNAHRIYSHEQVLELFSGLRLIEYALIPDGRAEDGLIQNPSSELIMEQSYGCGCYVFSK